MSDAEFDLQLRASYGVLAAIDQRLKIMVASQPETKDRLEFYAVSDAERRDYKYRKLD
jgi:hypothetical protein